MTGSMYIKSTRSWGLRSPLRKLRTAHSGIYDLCSAVLNDTAYEHRIVSSVRSGRVKSGSVLKMAVARLPSRRSPFQRCEDCALPPPLFRRPCGKKLVVNRQRNRLGCFRVYQGEFANLDRRLGLDG